MAAGKGERVRGTLTVGQPAPDFTLRDHNGDAVNLSDFRGRSSVVLFFYPKDDSPGCRREACSFRDRHADFRDLDAVILGVNGESAESHRDFARQRSLTYPLLTDTDGTVRERYGVPAFLGLFTSRVTFVIDKDGVVRKIIRAQFDFERHVTEALETARSLAN
jgi:peroxiredoxin Q/BCP